MKKIFLGATALVAASWVAPGHACTSCGCTLGTDWVGEGYAAGAGLRLDLRYDLINQSELRHGTHDATANDVNDALTSGSAEETQTGTLTRFSTLSVDYSVNHDWGVDVQLPLLARSHGTIAFGDTDPSFSDKDGIGDARVVGRYQGFVEDRSIGAQLGLKLPTGEFRQEFSRGPQTGAPLDRGLQLGTGTTDVIAGAYHFQALSREWDHFEQAQLKAPLNSRDEFRPGAQVFANAGLRYAGLRGVSPQVQLNVKWEGQESGDNSDRANSGSTEIYLSPGISGSPLQRLALYGFVQLPLWRDYRGLQLAPAYSVTTGLRYSF